MCVVNGCSVGDFIQVEELCLELGTFIVIVSGCWVLEFHSSVFVRVCVCTFIYNEYVLVILCV